MIGNVGPMSGVGPTLPASSVGFALGAQGVEELRIKKQQRLEEKLLKRQ